METVQAIDRHHSKHLGLLSSQYKILSPFSRKALRLCSNQPSLSYIRRSEIVGSYIPPTTRHSPQASCPKEPKPGEDKSPLSVDPQTEQPTPGVYQILCLLPIGLLWGQLSSERTCS